MTPRLFYGWWIVAAAVLLQFTFFSVSLATVSVFLRPVVDELGWQVWQFTLGSSLAIMAGALSSVVLGGVVDRHGPRLPVLGGALVAALCLYGTGTAVESVAVLDASPVRGADWLDAVRPAGRQHDGKQVVCAPSRLGARHRVERNLIGGVDSPGDDDAGGRFVGVAHGYYLLALFVLALRGSGRFLVRRKPEDSGLRPDGARARRGGGGGLSAGSDRPSYTSGQAVRTAGFWLLVLGYSMNQAALSSVLAHAIPFATDASFSRTIASLALAVNGLGNLVSKAVWGYCLQRFPPRRLAVTAFSLGGAGVGLMLLAAASVDPVDGRTACYRPAVWRILLLRLRIRRHHPYQRVLVGQLFWPRQHWRDPRPQPTAVSCRADDRSCAGWPGL